MFTGLIEETGEIAELRKVENALYLTVKAKNVLNEIKLGDSVAINGACQTVIEYSEADFKVFASSETLAVTTFGNLKIGSKVNLERTLRLSDRLDGHLVSGHIDGTARLLNIKNDGETTFFAFEPPKNLISQIVKKGSVCVDGISLTVSDIDDCSFKIAVIPHTLQSTALKYLKVGDFVNIETDIISKYVEKYLSSHHNSSNIDFNFLERNGFL